MTPLISVVLPVAEADASTALDTPVPENCEVLLLARAPAGKTDVPRVRHVRTSAVGPQSAAALACEHARGTYLLLATPGDLWPAQVRTALRMLRAGATTTEAILGLAPSERLWLPVTVEPGTDLEHLAAPESPVPVPVRTHQVWNTEFLRTFAPQLADDDTRQVCLPVQRLAVPGAAPTADVPDPPHPDPDKIRKQIRQQAPAGVHRLRLQERVCRALLKDPARTGHEISASLPEPQALPRPLNSARGLDGETDAPLALDMSCKVQSFTVDEDEADTALLRFEAELVHRDTSPNGGQPLRFLHDNGRLTWLSPSGSTLGHEPSQRLETAEAEAVVSTTNDSAAPCQRSYAATLYPVAAVPVGTGEPVQVYRIPVRGTVRLPSESQDDEVQLRVRLFGLEYCAPITPAPGVLNGFGPVDVPPAGQNR
ncbi:hypothetical protein [Streptomyces fractus]|uniref:hypothetical protein n=1 Tax=Streptomyces fractus TaxID=641806 RepID=UPI003CF07961